MGTTAPKTAPTTTAPKPVVPALVVTKSAAALPQPVENPIIAVAKEESQTAIAKKEKSSTSVVDQQNSSVVVPAAKSSISVKTTSAIPAYIAERVIEVPTKIHSPIHSPSSPAAAAR